MNDFTESHRRVTISQTTYGLLFTKISFYSGSYYSWRYNSKDHK